jgi:Protein of unknown function (DUF3987)
MNTRTDGMSLLDGRDDAKSAKFASVITDNNIDDDVVTVLVSRKKKLAKTWIADGTIESYGDALWFRNEEHVVSSLQQLGVLLQSIEADPYRCVIRGRLRTDWQKILDANLPKWNVQRKREGKTPLKQPGPAWVLRRLDLFEDVPHHWMMFDVDGFSVGEGVDHLGLGAIEKYRSALPPEFQFVSFVWQMSSSAGHPSSQGKLKAHAWFWSREKYGSAELAAWGQVINMPHLALGEKSLVDCSLFRTVQIHYTAAPVFEPGVPDSVSERSGFEDCSIVGDDAVELQITSEMKRKAGAPTKSKEQLVDPRQKRGWVGAFCRAFTIEDVVEQWLTEVFEWVTEYRLTWNLGGGSPEGAFVREDGQGIGASHNTWPWGANRTANKFDLVRQFKFGDLDAGMDVLDHVICSDRIQNLPSHRAMVEWVKTLPEVVDEFNADPDVAALPAPRELTNAEIEGVATTRDDDSLTPFPAPFPGPMTDAVDAALAAAPKPQPELTTLAVLVGMASCCAGQYHLPSGARLNHYGVGVAGTGWGKDSPRKAAVAIAKAGRAKLIGKPASGQGLEDAVEPNLSLLSEIDEIAHFFAAVNGSNAQAYLIELAGNLLRLYSASNGSYTTRQRAAARGVSPSRSVEHPCVNLIGFATPEKLGEAMSISNIEDGLMGRMLFAFGRPAVTPRRSLKPPIVPESVLQVTESIRVAIAAKAFDKTPTIEIQVAPDANRMLDELLTKFDAIANKPSSPFARSLQMRSFEKCERIAGVLAVWSNPASPTITVAHVVWAEQAILASDRAALHFCGKYMHGGQVQADAAFVLKTVKRMLNGEIKPQRRNELAHIKAGQVPRSMALRGCKLDKHRFDDAVAYLVDSDEITPAATERDPSNSNKHKTHLLLLSQEAA